MCKIGPCTWADCPCVRVMGHVSCDQAIHNDQGRWTFCTKATPPDLCHGPKYDGKCFVCSTAGQPNLQNTLSSPQHRRRKIPANLYYSRWGQRALQRRRNRIYLAGLYHTLGGAGDERDFSMIPSFYSPAPIDGNSAVSDTPTAVYKSPSPCGSPPIYLSSSPSKGHALGNYGSDDEFSFIDDKDQEVWASDTSPAGEHLLGDDSFELVPMPKYSSDYDYESLLAPYRQKEPALKGQAKKPHQPQQQLQPVESDSDEDPMLCLSGQRQTMNHNKRGESLKGLECDMNEDEMSEHELSSDEESSWSFV